MNWIVNPVFRWHCAVMESIPAAKSESSPFERMAALARRVMSVPKAEIDRRSAEAKKQRVRQKRTTQQ